MRLAAVALLFRSAGLGAAAFAPGTALPPDPPTGPVTVRETPVVESTPPASPGTGIRWYLAPIRYNGSVTLDGRWVRRDDGTLSNQAFAYTQVEMASHVWQPWFIQLSGSVGALVARDRTSGGDVAAASGTSGALSGSLGVAVFPSSRFPFQFNASLSDSRASGDVLDSQYVSLRIGVSQSYRPNRSRDQFALRYDFSLYEAPSGAQDKAHVLSATAQMYFGRHSVAANAGLSRNSLSETGGSTSNVALSLQHGYQPVTEAVNVHTTATYNANTTNVGNMGLESHSDLAQISSVATWRPQQGDWLFSPESPLYVTGSARLAVAGSRQNRIGSRSRTVNGTIGANYDWSRQMRLSASASLSHLSAPDASTTVGAVAGSLSYAFDPIKFGGWEYRPGVGGSVGASFSNVFDPRATAAAQASHGIGRSIRLGSLASMSLSLSQSGSLSREFGSDEAVTARSLGHSLGLSWSGASTSDSQLYGGVSLSDSRSWAETDSDAQLVNLQLNRRSQLSRSSSWSAGLTAQASRSNRPQIDPVTGRIQSAEAGWQRYYSGALSYQQSRLFGVPRLNYTMQLSLNSQQLESRALGDIDAPRQRISEQFENRVNYSIGRLDARLSALVVRIEGRVVSSMQLRLQRSF